MTSDQGQERIAAFLRWACVFDLIFHALVTWTLCCLPESQQSTSEAGKRLLHHRQRLLNKINEQLSQRKIDDVLIQAVTLLIPVDDHLGYTEFSQAHLAGIETMIECRGGLALVGSSEPAIGVQLATLVSISTTKLSINTSPQKLYAKSPLVYPSIPFSPSICEEISRLPSGFADLALSGQISIEMIRIIIAFDLWLQDLSNSPDRTDRGAWRFTVPSGLNDIEKHICIALLCLADDVTSMGLYYGALIFRKPQKRAESLFNNASLWHSQEQADTIVWLATVITTPLRPELAPFKARLLLYERILRARPLLKQWVNVEVILRRFFYCEERERTWKDSWESVNNHNKSFPPVTSKTLIPISEAASV
ncbi:hypothetical protein LTR84_012233 [Exophiala bonariae]|uniref:Transcription factor domain-containing protein n=1 Tax=Exophiala bonariae TaxID=1690606 RepID=A0AAV9NG09_9EURO|nr:hypothetical protein LTR84_012233 [Exophiala bonariae]